MFIAGAFTSHPYLTNGIFSTFMPQFTNGKRKRRHRTIFSEEQLNILEKAYFAAHYPDVNMREKLALQCNLKEERVEVWFKNRRAKERKKHRDFNEILKQGGICELSDGNSKEISEDSSAEGGCYTSEDENEIISTTDSTNNLFKVKTNNLTTKRQRLSIENDRIKKLSFLNG